MWEKGAEVRKSCRISNNIAKWVFTILYFACKNRRRNCRERTLQSHIIMLCSDNLTNGYPQISKSKYDILDRIERPSFSITCARRLREKILEQNKLVIERFGHTKRISAVAFPTRKGLQSANEEDAKILDKGSPALFSSLSRSATLRHWPHSQILPPNALGSCTTQV